MAAGLPRWSDPAEPIVAVILPEAAGERIGHLDRGDVLRVLEPELGRYPELHREAVLARQNLVAEAQRELGLRMQRRRHVEAGGIAVGAFEGDVAGAPVGADPRQKGGEAHARPFADRAPAFDADMADDPPYPPALSGQGRRSDSLFWDRSARLRASFLARRSHGRVCCGI